MPWPSAQDVDLIAGEFICSQMHRTSSFLLLPLSQRPTPHLPERQLMLHRKKRSAQPSPRCHLRSMPLRQHAALCCDRICSIAPLPTMSGLIGRPRRRSQDSFRDGELYETAAQQQLGTVWATTKSTVRDACEGEAVSAGSQSYVDLLTCIQMTETASALSSPPPLRGASKNRNKQ
jgi:hypothetical protein